ncbi:MAG: hypothetical protein PHI12_06980 [Dehalococcoidales bacterium]|nr:hypothetical protein [Dehalococcoidales bacterium]
MTNNDLQKLAPMSPASGPPLPCGLGVRWPWGSMSRPAPAMLADPAIPSFMPGKSQRPTLLSVPAIPAPMPGQGAAAPNVAKWFLGDIIKMNGKLYTVHAMDPYEQKYLLGDGAYPQDVVENYWRYTSIVDPVSSYVDHVTIIYYE